ncbi:unnamed protein product [Chrysoparadoxa australica]
MAFWKPGSVAPGIDQERTSLSEGQSAVIVKPSRLSIPQQRLSLPITQHRDAILYALEEYRTVVVVGETGCGKTTQIPQYLVEAGWCVGGRSVVCTQPRRVAAVTVAARIAEEMGVKLGEQVGYAVKFDSKCSSEPGRTAIKLCTDGTLLREMMLDPLLSRYSVVMLDEAHERTVYNDVLFGLLKKVMRRRPDLRVIVASATLDAEEFRDFFEARRGKGKSPTATILSVQGRQYPVDVLYMEEPAADFVKACAQVVLSIHKNEPPGDILVFMPGMESIDGVIRVLRDSEPKIAYLWTGSAHAGNTLLPVPLYAALPQQMQMAVFAPSRSGVRKVIVATNIAETSVTIDGVRYVVDPGFVKMPFYDPEIGTLMLVVTATSKASAKQRAGRAGRTRPGKCFRLMTQDAYRSKLPERTVPEMQRSNLSWVVLMLKALGVHDILHFDFLSPPSTGAMLRALELLYSLGALDDDCRLTTPLGVSMAELPVEPSVSRALLASWTMGCTEEMLSVAAMLTVQSVFSPPRRGGTEAKERYEEAMRDFAALEGDHITYLNVFNSFNEAGGDTGWCGENFVSFKALTRAREVRAQLERYVRRFASLGLIEVEEGDVQDGSGNGLVDRLRRSLVTGFFANSAKLCPDGRYRTVRDNAVVALSPSSVLAKYGTPPDYVLFHELTYTTQVFARDVSSIDPYWLIELAPHFFQFRQSSGGQVKRKAGPSDREMGQQRMAKAQRT